MTTTTQDLIRDAVMSAIDEAMNDSNNFKGEFLALIFEQMHAQQQAIFFNVLANRVSNWPDPQNIQWNFMGRHLTPEGKQLLDDMKAHTNKL
jgi:hypothetical protein